MTFSFLQEDAVQTLGWTLLHSLWELSAVAAFVATLLYFQRRAAATMRYLTACIGLLLMDKYMVGFEGAGMMILLGIVGAVLLARASTWRGDRGREADVAEDQPPTGLADETLWSDDTPPEDRR